MVVVLGDNRAQPRVSRNEMARNLTGIIDTVRSFGATPVLLVPPVASLVLYDLGDHSPFHDRHALYQVEIRRVALAQNTDYIDLQPIFFVGQRCI